MRWIDLGFKAIITIIFLVMAYGFAKKDMYAEMLLSMIFIEIYWIRIQTGKKP